VVVAAVMLDRLPRRATVVQIQGKSYRLKDKRKAGILAKPAEEAEAEMRRVPGGIPTPALDFQVGQSLTGVDSVLPKLAVNVIR
jgi:hypothetical protein